MPQTKFIIRRGKKNHFIFPTSPLNYYVLKSRISNSGDKYTKDVCMNTSTNKCKHKFRAQWFWQEQKRERESLSVKCVPKFTFPPATNPTNDEVVEKFYSSSLNVSHPGAFVLININRHCHLAKICWNRDGGKIYIPAKNK